MLLPEKRFLYVPQLAQAAGSEPLAARVEALRPEMHVFGHTHFSWNASVGGAVFELEQNHSLVKFRNAKHNFDCATHLEVYKLKATVAHLRKIDTYR